MSEPPPSPEPKGFTGHSRKRLAKLYRDLATLYFERSELARTPKLRRSLFETAARFQELASRHENHAARMAFGRKPGPVRRNYLLATNGYVHGLRLWRH